MKSDKYKPAPHPVSWTTRNKDKSKNTLQLQAGDLFDRVINLKFIRVIATLPKSYLDHIEYVYFFTG